MPWMKPGMLRLHVLRYIVYTISDASVVISATSKKTIIQCQGGTPLI